MHMSDSKAAKKTGCPICGQPSAESHAPFCSKRCAEIDLGRWLKGNYAIPTNEAPTAPESGEDD
jgi:endogenous inhibitor of DNA gyrase (YacG/DUF329 family)